MGKYRLAKGYEDLAVSPQAWKKLNPKGRDEKLQEFFKFTAKSTQAYTKPLNAGKKRAKTGKRRCEQHEPELFNQRIANVSPLKLRKTAITEWEVSSQNEVIDYFNPDRTTSRSYTLVLRNDHANCPKKVKRCENCKIQFLSDVVVVKTTGERQFKDKKGENVVQTGNIYLHYMTKCLKEFDQNFQFISLIVPTYTQAGLSRGNIDQLVRKGCKLA